MSKFFLQTDLQKLQDLCVEVIIHLKNLLGIFQKKRLEIKNFIVFLFKWVY